MGMEDIKSNLNIPMEHINLQKLHVPSENCSNGKKLCRSVYDFTSGNMQDISFQVLTS